jgi:hypothetical protein
LYCSVFLFIVIYWGTGFVNVGTQLDKVLDTKRDLFWFLGTMQPFGIASLPLFALILAVVDITAILYFIDPKFEEEPVVKNVCCAKLAKFLRPFQ